MPVSIQRYVISVLIPDRVGILSGITSAIADLGANIEGISQTVVQGYFTVIVIAAFKTDIGEDAIGNAIQSRFRKNEAAVLVRPFDPAAQVASEGDRYILTMSGKDCAGILKALTTYLAGQKINVEDLFFRISGEQVTHIGEVTVPRALDIKHVQDGLCQTMAPLGIAVSLQHENIFRATNEVGSVGLMLKENRHVSHG